LEAASVNHYNNNNKNIKRRRRKKKRKVTPDTGNCIDESNISFK